MIGYEFLAQSTPSTFSSFIHLLHFSLIKQIQLIMAGWSERANKDNWMTKEDEMEPIKRIGEMKFFRGRGASGP